MRLTTALYPVLAYRLAGDVQEPGNTIVPLRMYLKNNWAKVEIALVRGRRQYDKRQAIAKREADRHIRRTLKERDRQGMG
jgi:SsrA-binding protein